MVRAVYSCTCSIGPATRLMFAWSPRPPPPGLQEALDPALDGEIEVGDVDHFIDEPDFAPRSASTCGR
jgi:hypothetical protein